MGYFFNYDKGVHKHRIYAFEVKNDRGERVGFRPVVDRFNAKTGGRVEQVSDYYPEIKWNVFVFEKTAREFAIGFFETLSEEKHIRRTQSKT